MGFSDLGCYGGEIPTPNIDTLADERRPLHAVLQHGPLQPDAGRAADRPLSAPGRHGLPRQPGGRPARRAHTGRLRDDCVTMARSLGDAGYFTAMTGKWHLGQQHGTPPWKRGFARSLTAHIGELYFPNQQQRRDDGITAQRRSDRARRSDVRQGLVRPRPDHRMGPQVHRRGDRREEAVLLLLAALRDPFPAAGAARKTSTLPRQVQSRLGQAPRSAPQAADRDGPRRSRNGRSPSARPTCPTGIR